MKEIEIPISRYSSYWVGLREIKRGMSSPAIDLVYSG